MTGTFCVGKYPGEVRTRRAGVFKEKESGFEFETCTADKLVNT